MTGIIRNGSLGDILVGILQVMGINCFIPKSPIQSFARISRTPKSMFRDLQIFIPLSL